MSTMPVNELVSKIIAQSGVVHLYTADRFDPIARVTQDRFENLVPSGSELSHCVDSMRIDLYSLASRYFA